MSQRHISNKLLRQVSRLESMEREVRELRESLKISKSDEPSDPAGSSDSPGNPEALDVSPSLASLVAQLRDPSSDFGIKVVDNVEVDQFMVADLLEE